MKGLYWVFVGAFLMAVGCTQNKSNTLFIKRESAHTGITFKNELKASPQLNILNYLYYYNGAGVIAGDFNQDSLTDLYFTSNQGQDKLYLNTGNLTFQDITQSSNIQNSSGWTTGAVHVDINNDGLLDIYVCKVGNYKDMEGTNLLYVNQGVDEKGIPEFKEEAAKYNLDFSGFSTHAAFLDYDLDGDLDMYLMNHSVHPNRTYGRGAQRKKVDELSGDRLYQNDGETFIDVSATAGIFQGKSGYGLGLSVSDINNDAYPDIYIGNDFFENDYLYINQKDGTFKELISEDDQKLGHTSHYSMGNDIADINNDGLTDILSLDMLPENLNTYKTSGPEYGYPIYQQYLKNGYAPQYMQNTLHLNLGNENFAEVGNLSGLSATEWSWGTLVADFDNDGLKDVFVSNGIKGATNDMDFINFISNESIQRRIDQGMLETDMPLIQEIPEKKIPNYFFKNLGDGTFEDVTDNWTKKEPSFSNGCVYADLDNDGDLDIIVNNVDEEAFVLENTSSAPNNLTVTLKGNKKNGFGIGAKIISYSQSQSIVQENFVSKGYLSAVSPTIQLGLGKDSIIDSLKVIWPGGAYETLYNLSLPNQIKLQQSNAASNYFQDLEKPKEMYFSTKDSLVDFVHKETTSLDFDREPLVPFANSNEGPHVSVADINKDGLDDFFISGAKKQSSALYVQDKTGGFQRQQTELFDLNADNEDTSHTFFHANKGDYPDLIVVSGGNEYTEGEPLRPRLYLNKSGSYELDKDQFKDIETNASKVIADDFDKDGTQELIIVSDQLPTAYGKTPKQYFLKQNGLGDFEDVTQQTIPQLEFLGNIKDIISMDVDQNGYPDLIVVGHWFPVSIFLNDGNTFELQQSNGLDNTHGWWNTVKAADMDGDGDMDLLCGNWGLNSKIKASKERPVTLYQNDFDDNGAIDPIVTYYHKDTETPFASKDELSKQMPILNKKFLFYKDFAKASLEELFGKEKLEGANKKKVFLLNTTYFENDGTGSFSIRKLPKMAQSSSVNAIFINDIDGDGDNDALLTGNTFEISTQLGRLDASHGLLLKNDGNGNLISAENMNVSGAAREIEQITIDGTRHFIITRNNDRPVFLVKN